MEHFSFVEMCASQRADEEGIKNNPFPEACDNLMALVDNVLDPARKALGKPICVNSGFRSEELNSLIGGSCRSQHLKGEAADIELGGKTKEENKVLFDWISENCEYDQLINEYDYSWVHVSYKREGRNRKQKIKIG